MVFNVLHGNNLILILVYVMYKLISINNCEAEEMGHKSIEDWIFPFLGGGGGGDAYSYVKFSHSSQVVNTYVFVNVSLQM